MHLPSSDEPFDTDFRAKSTFRITLASLAFLLPFLLNSFMHHRVLSSISALAAFITVGLIFRSSYRRDSRQWLILLALVPAMIVFMAMAISERGITAALWCFPVVVSYYCMLDERKAWAANVLTLAIVIPLSWSADTETAVPFIASLVLVSLFFAISARVTTSYQHSLETRATTDPLTGLLNRSLLDITLSQAIDQYKRIGTPMTLLAIDLDLFKSINDTYGHSTGDHVLRETGSLIKQSIRLSDTCFRMGGEEFLCLLYGSDLENGKRIAELLRRRIQQAQLIPNRDVTISVGVACLEPQESRDAWCKRVDDHLYAAKHNGRNTVASQS